MKDNSNIILGSIAIVAVVITALILFLPKDDGKVEVNEELNNIKIYIHHEKTKEQDGYYSECKISTEDLIKVRDEYDKINNITSSDGVNGGKINGDYKVIVDDKYVAFDKEHSNKIYISDYNAVFKFESNIYDLVIKACS